MVCSKEQKIASSFANTVLCLVFVFLSSCSPRKPSQTTTELKVLTWSDYLKDSIIKEFETQEHVKVTLDYFSSNEELLAKVQASALSGSRGYDLIFPSDYMVVNMISLKLIQKLDNSKLNFLKNFEKNFQHPAYDPEHAYSIPFSWGSTGLVANTKLLPKDFSLNKGLSWKDVFENPHFAKQVTLMDDAKEVLHAALRVQGKSWAEATKEDISEAFQYLKKHKKNLKIFTTQTMPVMEAGECTLCHTFSGEALMILQKKPELLYFIPREGATLWTDNMAIPTNATHLELSYALMNKLLSTEAAKAFTEWTYFPSPIAPANASLDKSIRDNPSIFPPPETFKLLSYLKDRPELLPIIDRLWTEYKSL